MDVCYLLIYSLLILPSFLNNKDLNRFCIGPIKLVIAALRRQLNDDSLDGWLIHVAAYVLRLLTANGNGFTSKFWISKFNAPNEQYDV